jgi:hypothetical protein
MVPAARPDINNPNPARTEIIVNLTNASSHPIMIHIFDLLVKQASSIEENTESDTVIDLRSFLQVCACLKSI